MLAFDNPPGAIYLGDDRCSFCVWAPDAAQIEVHLLDPQSRFVALTRDEWGYWRGLIEDVPPGTRYRYRIDGERERPDPASRCQPEGVHGPSAVVDPEFGWTDRHWFGLPLHDYVVYELHVGTFSTEGSFDAIIPHLGHLKELGITAIEIMPVAHFPGTRNWGYDGVFLYAPHTAYGGVDGLKRLVDACHQQELAVVLDVVYNHLGPEGNYLWDYGPYFTDRYKTPWGDAVNYDGPGSDAVRHFIIANALYWMREYHIDALRLDAIHAIYDFSAYHLLEEMANVVHDHSLRFKRRSYLIAESDLNDPRIIRPQTLGGYGVDAQWSDDYHHTLHTLLTGERMGYYEDFGQIELFEQILQRGYAIAGEYTAHRGRRFGRWPTDVRGDQFVVCTQNHDQVGNRALGDRLSSTLSFAQLKLAAGALLVSPFVPMLFMGEEYGEPNPFQYFTDHSDPVLVEGVREGRKREFAAFVSAGTDVPDPQDPQTFERSRLNHALRDRGRHRVLWTLYRELLRLRRELPALATGDMQSLDAQADPAQQSLWLRRRYRDEQVWVGLNFGETTAQLRLPNGRWQLLIDSAAPIWAEDAPAPEVPITPGDVLELTELTIAPHSFVLLRHVRPF